MISSHGLILMIYESGRQKHAVMLNIIKSSNIYEQIIFILSNTPIQWRLYDEDAKVYMLINHVIHQRSKHQKSRYIFLEAVKEISNEQTYDNLLYWL